MVWGSGCHMLNVENRVGIVHISLIKNIKVRSSVKEKEFESNVGKRKDMVGEGKRSQSKWKAHLQGDSEPSHSVILVSMGVCMMFRK